MQPHATPADVDKRRHRPKTLTVFAAAFTAGAALAYGVDRVVDVHVVQVAPQVESEPIFVALRSLPQGSPVTIWDVALKDWPKAMMPSTAMKADASLEGMVLRHPIREGQPLLTVQLVRDTGGMPGTAYVAAVPAPTQAPTLPPETAAPVGAVERFMPATPAEQPEPPAADAASRRDDIPTAAVSAAPAESDSPAGESVPATAAESPAVALVEAARVDVAPPPASIAATPRSTDVDELTTAPTTAAAESARTEPAPADPKPIEPMPVAAVESVPQPLPVASSEPTPAPIAAVPPATAAIETPLAAPVPALPSTDIERSLTAFGRTHQPAAGQPATAGRRADDRPPASVLDRTAEAEPPKSVHPSPKYHLVVPERIALAVDASFTQPPQQPAATAEQQPAAAREDGNAAPAGSQARGGSRGRPTPQPAVRRPVPQQRPQPAARPQTTPTNRGFSAWMPKLPGTSRQR